MGLLSTVPAPGLARAATFIPVCCGSPLLVVFTLVGSEVEVTGAVEAEEATTVLEAAGLVPLLSVLDVTGDKLLVL